MTEMSDLCYLRKPRMYKEPYFRIGATTVHHFIVLTSHVPVIVSIVICT